VKIYLCISIDVEPDCSPSWHYSKPLAFTGVSQGVAEILHPLFREFEMQPTYLINNVVLENDESIAIFKSLDGKFELGTHLHGDFIEPGKIHSDYAGKDGVMNQCFLDPEIEYGKLKNITALFTDRFGYSPVSFRAGRFSAGRNTIRSLANLGYKVDTSVTPEIIWKDPSREQPVDFAMAPNQPYWTNENKFPGSSADINLLEVPVSIVMRKRYGIFKRALWLRPHYSDKKGLIKVWQKMVKNNREKPVVVLNMMFHNVEVMPDLNPYTKSKKDVMQYLDSLKRFFEYCVKMNTQPATLSNIYNYYHH
jgi:hypothetical protein